MSIEVKFSARARQGRAVVQPVPQGVRNGMPGFHDYTYRGKLTLEVELLYKCPGGCGRRMESDRFGLCAVCRAAGVYYKPRPPRAKASPGKRVQCKRCRSTPGGERCKRLCG